MLADVTESFNVAKSLVSIAVLSLLNIGLLSAKDCSYAIGFNLSNSSSADNNNVISTPIQSPIQDLPKSTVSPDAKISSFDKSLNSHIKGFDILSLNNIYVAETPKILSVDHSSLFTMHYGESKEPNHTSFVSFKNDIAPTANSKTGITYPYKLTNASYNNSNIAILGGDSSLRVSAPNLNNVKLDQFKFDPSGGLLVLGCLFLGKRYLRKQTNTNPK
ncbi:hypothetical protein H6F44_13730 [Pseudanabaena sp. FACHB-1277]|uniref:PEP-CTERM sorting domain-containing protein n=1 Tax=Pseudanabaena cinerea FACHB-1277 TaxID=2949581 RepID=A0A926Z6U5_9CYAN|nr:hypothetical protein [Pseudanabaena cinerea]MBD2151173.1 hypothetical protein [Pseudanabaena cinerea FACHB-1277]